MPNIIINASAGSGKTYQLAVAYLRALLQPLPDGSPTSPSQVLATTFTRAAASEILERVLRRLAEAVVSERETERLLADIKRPDLHRADLVRLLESVCRLMPQLQVGTIDGLFTRIIRVMGLELAFPHAWSIADETLAGELALAAADRILRGGEVREFRDQWRRYARFKPVLRVRSALVDLLEKNRFLLLGLSLPEDNPDFAGPQTLSAGEAEQLLEELAAFAVPLTGEGTPNVGWQRAFADLKASLAGEPALGSLFTESKLARAIVREEGVFNRRRVPDDLRRILGPVLARAREESRRLHAARLPALAAMARRYHLPRGEVAYARAAYTFSEIEAAAWILPSHLSQEDLYFRLDGQVQHLLLDEFQDTSLSQFRFLWPIIREVGAAGRLFFAVGDVKQSIYGWRGADRQLLNRLPGWISDPDLEPRYLPDNWRSCPAVLRAIDRLFENLDQAACLDPPSYSSDDRPRVEAHRRAASSFIAGYRAHVPRGENRHRAGRVRLLLSGPDGAAREADDDEPPGEIAQILRAVEQHRREDPDREIAILCRRRAWMPEILARLLSRGIVASGEGGNPVTDSAAVEMVLSMLTWLDHPGHSLAREHVKRGGVAAVFGFDESARDEPLARHWRLAVMRRGLAAVLAGWMRDEQFRAGCAVHDRVRSEQLIELARHWDAAGGGRLAGFVAKVRSQRVENPASAKVRVMTVHGSKGLEFEAVILADLEVRRRGGDGPRIALAMSEPDALPTAILLPDAEDAEILGLEEEYRNHQQGLFEEQLSVLYVALTRARSFLDVVIPAGDKAKDSLAGLLRERWGHSEEGEYVIDECPAVADAEARPAADLMGSDPGIALARTGVDVARLRFVPARREAVTPSGEEGGGVVELGAFLSLGNVAALERGTAVHALLERIAWRETLPPEKEWAGSVPRVEADPEACRSAARELAPRLRDPGDPLAEIFNEQAWLRRWEIHGVARLELWRERRFAAMVGNDLLSGSFDRVVLGYDAAGTLIRAEILDFKTDRVGDEREREERRLHYQPQLDAYAGALHVLTGLPPEAIQARLVWVNG
jgi:ATP-dependent exoDNAse (exonuclease V) beta subunit